MSLNFKWQDTLLYVILILIGCVIIALPTFPSMDGAAHLYNADVVKDLLLFADSSPYAGHYSLNSILVPNWFDHLSLGILLVLFKPLLAQKIFILLSIVTFLLIYNRVGRTNENSILSLAILPMVFSFFFFTGLYNQHWSYIVLIAYLLFLSNYEFQISESRKFYFTVFVFSIFFWITSILGFAIFLLITGFISVLKVNSKGYMHFTLKWKQIGILTAIVLPTLILTFTFVLSTPMSNAEPNLSLWNRLIGVFHLDFIKLYNMGGESYFLAGIGIIFTLILALLTIRLLSTNNYVPLIIMSVLFLAAVFVPNQAGAGMLSTRLAMYFWVVVSVFAKHYLKAQKLLYIASGLVFVCFFFINNKKYNTHINRLGDLGKEIYLLGENIGPSEMVLSLNETDDYYIGHMLDYACLKNQSINVSNYEANYPWFPVQWNNENLKSKEIDMLWKEGKKHEIMDLDLDWILVYGDLSAESNNLLDRKFDIHVSQNQLRLFKLRGSD
ncbi:MAG: hypothetical protein HKP14_02060 [Bacteroidia bacterium]|nr:hypothetical protein [Bacteroidia bacterium]